MVLVQLAPIQLVLGQPQMALVLVLQVVMVLALLQMALVQQVLTEIQVSPLIRKIVVAVPIGVG